MKNINLLKNLAVLSLLVLPTLSYSATQPAISIAVQIAMLHFQIWAI